MSKKCRRHIYAQNICDLYFIYDFYMYIWYMCARIYEEGSYQPSLLTEKSKITSTLKNEVTNHGSVQRWQVSLMLPHIKGSGFKPRAVWCWPSGCILPTGKIFRAHMLVITVVRWDWEVWQVATAGSMLIWCGKENIKAGHRRDYVDDASFLQQHWWGTGSQSSRLWNQNGQPPQHQIDCS